ncbi:MAG: hypothetical protein Q7T49_02060 [bacterium]|nr:hypothetical protein [bacterium]
MTKKKSGMSVGKAVGLGVGVAAVGAGAYYLLGPKGKQHQKKASAWAAEMKKEIEKELKKVKNVTKPLYQDTVDTIAKTYSKKYKNYSGEINSFAKKLKGEGGGLQHKTRLTLKKVKSNTKKVI